MRRCQAMIELLEKRDELIDISVRARNFANRRKIALIIQLFVVTIGI